MIADLNPVLRGWGNYFRTGNAADKFIQIDRHVAWRLKRLMIKRKGRNLPRRSGRSVDSSMVCGSRPAPTHGHDPLPRDRVSHATKIIGKPCAGKPHARN